MDADNSDNLEETVSGIMGIQLAQDTVLWLFL
jgi:hypothetical protein